MLVETEHTILDLLLRFWRELLVLILSPTLVVGAVALLARRFMDRTFERDLERFKSQLALEVDIASKRASLLHEKRAEVVGLLYGLIVKAHRNLAALTATMQPGGGDLAAKRKETLEAVRDAVDYFDDNRIYLPATVIEPVEAVSDLMFDVLAKFSVAQRGEKYEADPSGLWLAANRELRNRMPSLTKDLEGAFQTLLEATTVRPDAARDR